MSNVVYAHKIKAVENHDGQDVLVLNAGQVNVDEDYMTTFNPQEGGFYLTLRVPNPDEEGAFMEQPGYTDDIIVG